MIEWPSVYFKGWGQTLILIALYVDDLLIAAAKAIAHRALTELHECIQIGEHSDLAKYLVCNHHLGSEDGISRCRFDMCAYLKAAYTDFTQRANLTPKLSAMPYAPELPKAQTDDLIARPGIYGKGAAHYLMRLMFAARVAYPELALAIQRLACQITKWPADCDRRLVRLYGYTATNPNYMFTGFVTTEFDGSPYIVGWPDEVLAGAATTSRSSSGHYVELCTGDQHHFPLSWSCLRQTSTSCHTCEAETVSLATCLRRQALPAQQRLDRFLGSDRVVHQGGQFPDDQHDHARVLSGPEVPEAHSAHRPGLLARGEGTGARPPREGRHERAQGRLLHQGPERHRLPRRARPHQRHQLR